jgi:flagellar hook assembly protein FlgD
MMAMQGASTVVDVPVSRVTAAKLLLGISGANPFAHATAFTLVLPTAGRVRMRVTSADGRTVATLMDGWRPAGTCRVAWSGCDDSGRRVPSGLYLARAVSMSEAACVRIVKVE